MNPEAIEPTINPSLWSSLSDASPGYVEEHLQCSLCACLCFHIRPCTNLECHCRCLPGPSRAQRTPGAKRRLWASALRGKRRARRSRQRPTGAAFLAEQSPRLQVWPLTASTVSLHLLPADVGMLRCFWCMLCMVYCWGGLFGRAKSAPAGTAPDSSDSPVMSSR